MKTKVRCIIVDDEPAAHYVLQNYIARNPDLAVVYACYNGVDALSYLQSSEVDLMFLDIDMPDITGLELLHKLQKFPQTILTTAYSEFALESYDHGVLDYLLKPIFYPRFEKAIERFLTSFTQGQPDVKEVLNTSIRVKVNSDLIDIVLDDILYAQSYGNYVKIVTAKRNYTATITTADLERSLPSEYFMRAHKSYIIAISKVTRLHKDSVEIRRTQIPIGITYKRELIERLKS